MADLDGESLIKIPILQQRADTQGLPLEEVAS